MHKLYGGPATIQQPPAPSLLAVLSSTVFESAIAHTNPVKITLMGRRHFWPNLSNLFLLVIYIYIYDLEKMPRVSNRPYDLFVVAPIKKPR